MLFLKMKTGSVIKALTKMILVMLTALLSMRRTKSANLKQLDCFNTQ